MSAVSLVLHTQTPQQWTPANVDQINQYIQTAMNRNGGNVQLAFADLRDQRQQPANYYNTNMSIAADYLRARWDVQQHGALAETLQVDAYMELKRTGNAPPEGPGPVSPYSDLEASYMYKGIQDEANYESFWEQVKWAIPVVPVFPIPVTTGVVKAVWDDVSSML